MGFFICTFDDSTLGKPVMLGASGARYNILYIVFMRTTIYGVSTLGKPEISGTCSRWQLETKNEGVVCPLFGGFGQRKMRQRPPDMVFGGFVRDYRVRSMQTEHGGA